MTHKQAGPLSDAEAEEMSLALAALSPGREPIEGSILDGFLAGILVNPTVVPQSQWLPRALTMEEPAADPGGGAAPSARLLELIQRRYNYLAACIAGREPFDPLAAPLIDAVSREIMTGPSGVVALSPWAAGFMHALVAFPGVLELAGSDPLLALALGGILRHLPDAPLANAKATREMRASRKQFDFLTPLPSLEVAVVELVGHVLDVADITRPRTPVVRAEPKVGRNMPCPCGSGRKYKQCHGRAPH